VRVVDLSASNSWAEFASVFRSTRQDCLLRENAKSELNGLMPEDVVGIRRSAHEIHLPEFDVWCRARRMSSTDWAPRT
jgi:hypothetical protein